MSRRRPKRRPYEVTLTVAQPLKPLPVRERVSPSFVLLAVLTILVAGLVAVWFGELVAAALRAAY